MSGNKPKSDRATCRNCGETIFWSRKRFPKWQEEENKAVEIENNRRSREAEKNKEPGDTWGNWRKTLEILELPHKPERGQSAWTESWWHYSPEEGSFTHCLATRKKREDRDYYYGPGAVPKEFCARTIRGQYSSPMCNRPVKGEWEDEPLCGTHLAAEKKAHSKQEAERQADEVKQYIIDSVKEFCDILKEDYGLEATVHMRRVNKAGYPYYEHQPTGKVAVDPKALLALLEETFE